MATVGRSNIEITADTSRARRSLGDFFRQAENSGRNLARIFNTLDPFTGIQQGSSNAAGGLNNLNNAANNLNSNLNNLGGQNNLNQLNGDLSDAEQNMDDLHQSTGNVGDGLDDATRDMRDFGNTAERESSNAEGSLGKLGDTAKKIGGFLVAAFAVDQIKDFATDLAATAGAAEASKAQFSTVFGDMEGEAAKRLSAIGGEATILENRMKDSFTKIAAFAKTGGMDTADSLDLADRSMRAVADSAAFYDRSLEDTTESLQSFLKGNFENDAALGLSSTETTRNAAANELYGKSFKDLSEAQKQLTSLQMVEDANKLTGALGQASRESDGWENVVGNMTQAWTDFKAEIGAPVLRVAVAGIKGMTAAVQSLNTEAIGNGIEKSFNFISGSIKKAKDAIAPFVEGVKGIAGAFKRLMTDDGQAGRDILKGMGFSEETIMMLDGYAARIGEFRHKVADYVEAIKGLFYSDGQSGRDMLASLGFSEEVIAKLDAWAQNISAFRGNVSNTIAGLRGLFQGERAGGLSILRAIGFTDDFIKTADNMMSKLLGIRDTASNVFSAISKVAESRGQVIRDVITAVFITVWPLVKSAFSSIFGFLSGTFGKIVGFFKTDGAQIIQAIINVGKGIGVVFLGIMKVIQFVMPLVMIIIKSVWKNIQGVITGALDIIMGVVKIFSGLFTGDFKKMWEGLKQVFVGAVVFLWNFIQLTFFGKILGGVKVFVLSFRTFFVSLWQGIIALFKGNTTGALLMIRTAWATILRNTKDVFGAVAGFFKNIWASIVSILTGRLLGIRTMVLKAWSFISTSTTEIFDNVKGYFVTLWDWVTDLFGKAASAVGSGLKAAWDFIVNITKTVFGLWLTVVTAYWGFIAEIFTGAFKLISKGVTAAWNGIVSVTTTVFNGIKNFLTAIWSAIYNAIAPVVSSIWNYVKPIFEGMWELVKSVFNGIKNVISTIWSAISQIFTNVGAAIVGIASEIWTNVYNSVSEKFTAIKNYISNVWNTIKTIFLATLFILVKTVRDKFAEVNTETTTKFTAIKDFFSRVWSNIKKILTDTINGILNFLRPAWDSVSSKTSTVFNAVKDFLSRTWTGIRNTITGIVDAILSKIRIIWDAVYSKTSAVFNTIKDFISRIWGNVRDTIGNALSSVRNKVAGAWDAVLTKTRSAFGSVFTAVKGKFDDIVNTAKNLPQRIGDGLKNMAGKVSSGVNSLVNKMSSGLENGVNGVIGGINSVLGALGVTTKIDEISIPRYAHGTDAHPGGLAQVNDGTGDNAGPEMIIRPNGTAGMLKGKNVVGNFEKGTQVISAKNTRKLLASIPAYNKGKGLLNSAIGKGKEVASHAWDKVYGAGKKVKELALDVFEYLKNPSGLLDAALKALGVEKPGGTGFADNMAKGGWDKVKSSAVGFIKGKLNEFGDDGGTAPGFGRLFGKSSSFGWRMHPILKKRIFHNGADYPAPPGTLIKAQAAGKVIQSAFHAIRGNFVRIQSGIMERIYQHNSRNLVSTGDMVRQGQGIGTVGSTGRSTGPHLHYEVKKNGKNINPQGFFKGGIVKAKQLAWIAEKGMEAIIPLVTNRAEGIDLWKQVGQHFGFDTDAIFNQGQDRVDYSGSAVSSIINKVPGANGSPMATGSGITLNVDVKPAPVYLDGQHLTDIMFDHVDARFVRQAETENYFKGRE